MLVIISEQESNKFFYTDGTDNEVAMIEDYQMKFILSCLVELTRGWSVGGGRNAVNWSSQQNLLKSQIYQF